MTRESPLWRVWFENRTVWKLVAAPDSDAVYKSFAAKKRRTITRVDRVLKTSEGVAKRLNEAAERPVKRRGLRGEARKGNRQR